MSMTAKIKLFSRDNKLMAMTTVSDENYVEWIDPPEFIDNAWNLADKMAVHLSDGDYWRLSMTIDLDCRGAYQCTK